MTPVAWSTATRPHVTARWRTAPGRFGPFTVVATEDAVLASGWTADPAPLVALVHPSLRPDRLVAARDLGAISDAVAAYDDGVLAAIDAVPVVQRSGPFLARAREVLRTVAPGAPVTYARLAALAGNPAAARAAAAACSGNAAALFVPCHRVVRADGGIGGFGWGVEVKRALLLHESA